MPTCVLWRWENEKWNYVKSLGNKNVVHCSRYEIVVSIFCNPNEQGIRPE